MPGIEGFELPQKVDVEISDVNEFGVPLKATFTTEPWAHGFGNTIGNALRRVLLSSMEGVAVSSILIPKVAHEFSSIPDVLEDVMDIILNIKKLKFTCDGETPHSVELYADKAGPVTGANIREDGIVTVLNKDQIICTLDTDRQFEMHLELDRGKGYRPSELNKRDDQPIGTIPVDCLFSPIERVSYDVQACRVGSNTDYDRLELTVWADGRIDPRDAVKKAARILTDHLAVFVGDAKESAGGIAQVDIPEFDEESLDKIQKLCQGVDTLEFSVRAVNVLEALQIKHIFELVEKPESELLKHRNCGKKTVQEIKQKLQDINLGIGMTLTDDIKNEVTRRIAAEQIPNKED